MISFAFFACFILFMNIVDPHLAKFAAWAIMNILIIIFSLCLGTVLCFFMNLFYSGGLFDFKAWVIGVSLSFLVLSFASIWYVFFKRENE